jgi:hypothetical protein
MAGKPIWNIAHRCNNASDIESAVEARANAIEFDVMSDDGFIVKHPGSIDFSVPSLKAHLRSVMKHKKALSLLYVDYKGPSFSASSCKKVVARLVAAGIPGAGIRVVFSIASATHAGCFEGLPKADWIVPQLDEANTPAKVVQKLSALGFTRAWYGDGIASILPEPDRVEKNIRKAIKLRNAGGILRGVVIWTLKSEASMRRYLKLGVNAVLTDDPEDMHSVLAASKAYRRAKKTDLPW